MENSTFCVQSKTGPMSRRSRVASMNHPSVFESISDVYKNQQRRGGEKTNQPKKTIFWFLPRLWSNNENIFSLNYAVRAPGQQRAIPVPGRRRSLTWHRRSLQNPTNDDLLFCKMQQAAAIWRRLDGTLKAQKNTKKTAARQLHFRSLFSTSPH